MRCSRCIIQTALPRSFPLCTSLVHALSQICAVSVGPIYLVCSSDELKIYLTSLPDDFYSPSPSAPQPTPISPIPPHPTAPHLIPPHLTQSLLIPFLGVLLHFSTLVCAFAFFSMGLDLMLRVTGKGKSRIKYYLAFSVVFPVILVVLNGAYGQYGYGTSLVTACGVLHFFFVVITLTFCGRHNRHLHLTESVPALKTVNSNVPSTNFEWLSNFFFTLSVILSLSLYLSLSLSYSLSPILPRRRESLLSLPIRLVNNFWKYFLLHSPCHRHRVWRHLLLKCDSKSPV